MGAYDYSTDPVLAEIRLNAATAIAQAQAQAAAERTRSLIAYGDSSLAKAMHADKNTVLAAQNNPYSTVQTLKKNNANAVLGINEGNNKQNTFYGSQEVRDRGLQQQAYGKQQADAYGNEQQALDNINAALLAAEQNATMQVTQAEGDAYGRATAAAQNGQAPATGPNSDYGSGMSFKTNWTQPGQTLAAQPASLAVAAASAPSQNYSINAPGRGLAAARRGSFSLR